MDKPTLDLDLLVGGRRVAEESTGRPFYVISFGSSANLRTQDRRAAENMMMGLVGFDEVTVTIRTFASLEELDYQGRFEQQDYEIRRVFGDDWRRWMDHQKKEEAREIRERSARDMHLLAATPAPAPKPPAEEKKGDDVPF